MANTLNPQDITQEEAIQWAMARLDNERSELVEQFSQADHPREIERLTCQISQISLRILKIEQHLEDFEDLKHFKAYKEEL